MWSDAINFINVIDYVNAEEILIFGQNHTGLKEEHFQYY